MGGNRWIGASAAFNRFLSPAHSSFLLANIFSKPARDQRSRQRVYARNNRVDDYYFRRPLRLA